MKLPESITMGVEFFADGKNGSATQGRTNKEYGIHLKSERKTGSDPFVDIWYAEALPESEFSTYDELRTAMLSVSKETQEKSVTNFKSDIDILLEAIEERDKDREKLMPDEKSALNAMFEAYLRLKELGFKEASYCPKDGTMFDAIEAGSTGIFDCNYSGEWPDGRYTIFDSGDAYPSRPILFRLKP